MLAIHHILFYDLFLYLKDELKIELDFEQFEAFVQLLLVQNWQQDMANLSASQNHESIKRKLKNLCLSLWIPQKKYKQAFEEKFEELFADVFQQKTIQDDTEIDLPTVIDASGKKSKPLDTPKIEETTNTDAPSIEKTKDTKEPNEDEPIETEEDKTISYKNMFVDFSTGGEGNSETIDTSKEASIRDNPFVFSDDKHLPLASRKALQLWRKINTYSHRVEGNEIDVKATVKRMLKEGFLYEPVKRLEKKGKIDYFLFVEHDGPMIAFRSWWQQLEQSLQNSNKNSALHTYYFNNYPLPIRGDSHQDYHLFLNTSHTLSEQLSEIQQAITKDSIVLFFSDAGALDRSTNNNRIQETWKFIQTLQKLTKHLLWINPIPEKRWEGSSAAILSMLIPMVTYNFNGIEQGIKILRD